MTLPRSLVKEHWLIRRVLNALDAFTTRLEQDPAFDRADLEKFSSFFRVYGDEHHAEKEEQILLPQLALAGADWYAGPLEQARREHRQERYFMRVLKQFAEREEDFDAAGVRHLRSELEGFIESMRAHLTMEDQEILPLVRNLDEPRRRKLEEALERFDSSAQSKEIVPVQTQIADELTQRYSF